MTAKPCDLLIRNAGELLTLETGAPLPRQGPAMEDLGLLHDGAVAVTGERIVEVGKTGALEASFRPKEVIDAKGGLLAPGFVDPHTHPVFAATREHEFEMRVKGTPYEEIARRGGGILSSVRAVREASPEELEATTRRHLDGFLAHGTTTIEAKSGYGLTTADELKSLEVLAALQRTHPLDLVPTFLGAHEIPAEYRLNREAYIRILLEEMIPEVGRRGLARYCDVFCERNVYTVEESKRILTAAKDAGMKPRIHADEFSALGGSELAGELKAVTADHLVAITDSGIRALREGGVIPVFLPATTFYLDLPSDAPARKMIDAGLPVALSTDFNPGSSMTESMQFVLTLACVRLKMTPAEAFTAATVNGACAVELAEDRGRLAPDLLADIVLFDVPNHRALPYHFGVNHVRTVVKRGKVVVGPSP
jgi:imidazolonepropionase